MHMMKNEKQITKVLFFGGFLLLSFCFGVVFGKLEILDKPQNQSLQDEFVKEDTGTRLPLNYSPESDRVTNNNQLLSEEGINIRLPFDYFPESDLIGGSDTWAIYGGEAGYQSYPTTTITISNEFYLNEDRKASTTAELLSHGETVGGTRYFDVDGDGKKEMILDICADGANHCPDRQEVIKNGIVIFSLRYYGNTIGGSIEESSTHNGFYANWYSEEDFRGGLCCPSGHTKTRFVYKNSAFIPVFEQKIGYIEITNI